MRQTKIDAQVFRPSVLPDDKRIVWYPLILYCVAATLGWFFNSIPLSTVPLLFAAVFPGMPIAIHTVFFLSIKMTLDHDTLTVFDLAGDPLVSYPRRQKIGLSQISYVYHLRKEAEAYKSSNIPSAPFRNTLIDLKKYHTANSDLRGIGAVARSNRGLVLSDKEGERKIYMMHFYDLAKKDWQRLGHLLQKANPDISFLMDEKEIRDLFGE